MQQTAAYDLETTGRRLAAGMAEAGLSSQDLADKTGLSIYSINDWKAGRSGMNLASAVKICDVLNWSLDRLVCRTEGEVA